MKRIILTIAVTIFLMGCNNEELETSAGINNSNFKTNNDTMGKILLPYEGLTAQQIIDKATPGVATLVVSGANVDASNITTTGISNALSEPITSDGGLCSSPKVNIWSGFGPIQFYNNGGVLASKIATPYELGSFAGYNHNAPAPYIQPNAEAILNSYYGSSAYDYTIKINLGEVNWTKFGFDYCYILLDGAVYTYFPLSSYTANTLKSIVLSLATPAPGYSRNYSVTVWMGNDIQKTCNMTQVSSVFTITVKNLPQFLSHTLVNSSANRSVIGDYLSINTSTEYVSNIYMQTFNLAFNGDNLTGKYLITAEIKRKTDNALLRTMDVGGGSAIERPNCIVSVSKSNNNITSSVYTANSNYAIGSTSGGYAYTFAIPAQLLPKADGDYYSLVFDSFH